jgi:carbamoyltransferase
MKVLGIAESHASSACLMMDGAVVGMIQEERFTKRKNQAAFPLGALRSLLGDHLAGDAQAVDKVVFAERWVDPYYLALDRYSDFSIADHVAEQHRLWHPHFYEGGVDIGAYWREEYLQGRHLNQDHNHDLSCIEGEDWGDATRYFSDVERPKALERWLGWSGTIATVDHHTCHAYYAYYGNRLPDMAAEQVLVLTADAWGEGRNWSAWTAGPDGTLDEAGSGDQHLVARLYKFVTLILGMKPNEHEYKVMGLAPYGRNLRYVEPVERVLDEILDFRDGAFVSERPLKDSYFDLRRRLEGHRFDNVAAGVQRWASRVTCAWAQHWLRETGRSVLCLSGGLAMNIRICGDLMELPELAYLSVPASGGDESLCAGACFADAAMSGDRPQPIRHVYLGSEAQITDWDERLHEVGANADDFSIIDDVGDDDLAALLAADFIIARCTGPSEFGARALGNRSILANPARAEHVRTINDAIKNRDFWMPFTPSILKEHASELLRNPKSIDSPFMTIGFAGNDRASSDIAAAVHAADKSVRPQFVDRETNASYWNLIEAFRRLTGIPALLNTSLNLHGEPMNYTIADAARTLASSALSYLVLPGQQLLCKREAEAAALDILGRRPR